jgi:acetyl-CoA carboxylase carboxyl transferase subunit alpha
MKFDIVDAMIEEPLGGAHHDPAQVYCNVKKYILEQWNILSTIDPEFLIEQRYQKYRRMGKFFIEENQPIA